MPLYVLHMIIFGKNPEWATGQVFQDHMAMVCRGVFGAVVSVRVPLFGVKGAKGGRERGIICTAEHIRAHKTHTNRLPRTQ